MFPFVRNRFVGNRSFFLSETIIAPLSFSTAKRLTKRKERLSYAPPEMNSSGAQRFGEPFLDKNIIALSKAKAKDAADVI
jgi:hypothetical protein